MNQEKQDGFGGKLFLVTMIAAFVGSVSALYNTQQTKTRADSKIAQNVDAKLSGFTKDNVPTNLEVDMLVPNEARHDGTTIAILRHRLNDHFQKVSANTLSSDLDTREGQQRFITEACAGLNDVEDLGYVVTQCKVSTVKAGNKI